MADNKVEEGDKVSWNWRGANPEGTVGEVKAGEVTVTSQRGNEIKKTGDETDPAVHIEEQKPMLHLTALPTILSQRRSLVDQRVLLHPMAHQQREKRKFLLLVERNDRREVKRARNLFRSYKGSDIIST
ncbi:ab2c6399-a452-487c-8128-b7446aeed6ac [Sclerotinia trifoliorum]|uniref:Ab2c6399-a452-487c-8128-b7446aeed6ac n=1 Tax=Sclerotinia trifoliorum TaxID=28548 RepID=A0A8H2ZSC9_9HELO|nr:ab2c6399-a452-487c-8128-b7446aeed6ac [Sclerotinia trifoliorum]